MPLKVHCPGCRSHSLSNAWVIPDQPVVLNYRFPCATAATALPRADIHLVECRGCDLIFNSSLDEALIPYDGNYNNRQGFSLAFTKHLEDVANSLLQRHELDGGVVFEVGCGKGDFLRLLCWKSNSSGIGFDTSCEEEGESGGSVVFYRRYATEDDVPRKVNVILCRHVVEHVGEIGDFLALLHRMAVSGNADTVYLETPTWEWIRHHNAFWDVFYDYCNYFPEATLARLAENAGFLIQHQNTVFGGQYQALHLIPNYHNGPRQTGACALPSMAQFATTVGVTLADLQKRIRSSADGGDWGIWGAGAKGVTLANRLTTLKPAFVVDANPDKCGNYIPGTAVPIVAPKHDLVRRARAILVANPNYTPKIRTRLAELDLNPTLLFV